MSDWLALRDSLGLTLRPIDRWPAKMTSSRTQSPYRGQAGRWTPLSETLATLKRELGALRARGIILQIAIPEKGLRLDGLPRAGATAEHPGVILAFESKYGPMRIFFDGFTRWQCNFRGIALHLEHLRKASLYGVGEDGQQYRGWAALPSGTGDDDGPVALLQRVAAAGGWKPGSGSGNETELLIREALKVAHPDKPGGNHELFLAVQDAAAQVRAGV